MWGAAVVMPAAPCFLSLVSLNNSASDTAYTFVHTPLEGPRNPLRGRQPPAPGWVDSMRTRQRARPNAKPLDQAGHGRLGRRVLHQRESMRGMALKPPKRCLMRLPNAMPGFSTAR